MDSPCYSPVSCHKRKQQQSSSPTTTYAAQVFANDWNSFQLSKKAIEACDCEGNDGLCACFMRHEEGRALFANHCSMRQYLQARRQRYETKLHDLQFWTSYRPLGTVDGCTCPTEDCHCSIDSTHPWEVTRRESYDKAKATILKEWNAELLDYGLSTSTQDDAFAIPHQTSVMKATDAQHKEKKQKLWDLADAFTRQRHASMSAGAFYSPPDTPGRSSYDEKEKEDASPEKRALGL